MGQAQIAGAIHLSPDEVNSIQSIYKQFSSSLIKIYAKTKKFYNNRDEVDKLIHISIEFMRCCKEFDLIGLHKILEAEPFSIKNIGIIKYFKHSVIVALSSVDTDKLGFSRD